MSDVGFVDSEELESALELVDGCLCSVMLALSTLLSEEWPKLQFICTRIVHSSSSRYELRDDSVYAWRPSPMCTIVEQHYLALA